MNRADKLPLVVRCRMACRAAWACLRGDAAVLRVPGRPEERRPMCSSLPQCCQTIAELDRAETEKGQLLAEVRTLRSRLAHPSNREPRS